MLQNTFKSHKFTVRIWDNVGVIIPKSDLNFEINSNKFNYPDLGHFEHRRKNYPIRDPPHPLNISLPAYSAALIPFPYSYYI